MEWSIERLDTCDSTQDEAMARARDGAAHGTVVIASRMEDGRGQHGRGWHAPEGGLYLSVVLRDIQEAKLVTLALGVAVADVLEVAGAEPRLKWVNDVLVDDKKVAGILVEGESTGDALDFLAAGIGLNVNGDPAAWPSPLNDTATTLEAVLGAENCMEDLEAFLLESLDHRLRQLAQRPEDVVAAWRAKDALMGREVGFDPDGDLCAKLIGTAAGIDDDGRLLIDVDGERQAFSSGRVWPHGN